MKLKKINISYREFSLTDLNADDKALIKNALKATATAYAPYSNFRVGAAARLASGKIVTGSNQENAAYPSGLCAERVALFFIQSEYPGDPVCELAIAAKHNGKQTSEPVYPCGSCRQVLLEHENQHKTPIRILMAGSAKVIEVRSASLMLPLHFSGNSLKKSTR